MDQIGGIVIVNRSLPTVDEIVSSLKRSFIPTILIEGPDDAFIYRWLKSRLDENLVSLQPCGGRDNLFAIFERMDEFKNKKIIFIADKDGYRFTGVPDEKQQIIFTTGYCIENDIYAGSQIFNFLDEESREDHGKLRELIGEWFAFEIERFMNNSTELPAPSVSVHINRVVPVDTLEICPIFSESVGFLPPSEEIRDMIFNEYDLNVRGKQLFQMLSRFLSYKGRYAKFSDKNLIEIAIKSNQNEYVRELIDRINYKFKECT